MTHRCFLLGTDRVKVAVQGFCVPRRAPSKSSFSADRLDVSTYLANGGHGIIACRMLAFVDSLSDWGPC